MNIWRICGYIFAIVLVFMFVCPEQGEAAPKKKKYSSSSSSSSSGKKPSYKKVKKYLKYKFPFSSSSSSSSGK
jgi:hypothetical protein